MDVWMDGWKQALDGWMDGWMDGRKHWINGWMAFPSQSDFLSIHKTRHHKLMIRPPGC